MRRSLTVLLLSATALTVLAACSGKNEAKNLAPKSFCEAMAAYETKLVRTTTSDKAKAARRQLPALEKVRALSPADIRADVQTMVDAYEKVIAGTPISTRESQDLDKVVERVERYGVERCALLKQQTGGGVV